MNQVVELNPLAGVNNENKKSGKKVERKWKESGKFYERHKKTS